MASEEERAAILAEYAASLHGDDDDDDEADFNPHDEDEDDGDEDESDYDEDFGDSDEEEEDNDSSAVILTGEVSMNDEGRIIYCGKWSKKNGEKKSKFKLKSKKKYGASGKKQKKDASFTLCNPVGSSGSRTILFDGFFFTIEENGSSSRKVKERDMEMIISVAADEGCKTEETSKSSLTTDSSGVHNGNQAHEDQTKNIFFQVKGRGCNEFGAFTFTGEYRIQTVQSSSTDDHTNDSAGPAANKPSDKNTMICVKRYIDDGDSTRRQGEKNRKHIRKDYIADDGEDDALSDVADDEADFEELSALHQEAHLSVEDLRSRYYNYQGENNGGEGPAAKKARREPDSDNEPDF